MITSCGMNDAWLDILLRAAAMRFNDSWMAFVRTETDVARGRYRYEMARMNRVLISRGAPGIAPLVAADQRRNLHIARQNLPVMHSSPWTGSINQAGGEGFV
jgi:hypothetical protein